MSPATLLVTAVVVFVLAGYYSQATLRNKILCTFRRANKTQIEKFVSQKAKVVIFDGGKYRVMTNMVSLFWYTRGIHQFFPTWVPKLDFTYKNALPIDPDTGTTTWATPEVEKMLGSEEDYIDFAKGAQIQSGVKQGTFQRYLPYLTIAAVAIIAIILYKLSDNFATMGNQLTAMQQQIQQLLRR